MKMAVGRREHRRCGFAYDNAKRAAFDQPWRDLDSRLGDIRWASRLCCCLAGLCETANSEPLVAALLATADGSPVRVRRDGALLPGKSHTSPACSPRSSDQRRRPWRRAGADGRRPATPGLGQVFRGGHPEPVSQVPARRTGLIGMRACGLLWAAGSVSERSR
jgi:hypothetical protein